MLIHNTPPDRRLTLENNMPTYEYECGACGHGFEIFQSITESPKKKCPACGKMKAKRLIGSGAALIFKGSGFYQTDYRSSEYKQKAKAENSSSSSPAGGDNGSSKPKEKSGD